MLDGVRPGLDDGSARLLDHFATAKASLDSAGEAADQASALARRCASQAGLEGPQGREGLLAQPQVSMLAAGMQAGPCRLAIGVLARPVARCVPWTCQPVVQHAAPSAFRPLGRTP